jgi:hypothetical protein
MESVSNVARSGAVITVAQLLEAAREGLPRLFPERAHEAVRAGAALVDTRSDEQRRADGEIACATCIFATSWNGGSRVSAPGSRAGAA